LRDIQLIHSRMMAEIDRVDGGLSARSSPGRSPGRGRGPDPSGRGLADSGEDLDVPEFIPPG
jgi:hypothetical protein